VYIINVVGSSSDVVIKKTTNLETNLHGLAKFANYSVRVLAFTSAGEGVRSSPFHCTTEEDGESHTVIVIVKRCTISTITWCICLFWWSFSGHCWFTCIYIQSQWLFLPEMVQLNIFLVQKYRQLSFKLHVHIFVLYVCFFCSMCLFFLLTVSDPPEQTVPYILFFCLQFQASLNGIFHVQVSSDYHFRHAWRKCFVCLFVVHTV
jgi:hypothetical protein